MEERIKVKVKATGKTGTIPKKEFNPDIYELGGVGGAVSKYAPVAGAVVGGLAGLPFGLAPAGAAAGYGAGYAMRGAGERLAGVNQAPPEQQLGQMASGTANSALAGFLGQGAAVGLPYLLRAFQKGGNKEYFQKQLGEEIKAVEKAKPDLNTTDLLRNKFMSPGKTTVNPELTKGLTSAGGDEAMTNILKKEIQAQGHSGGGAVPQPTLTDILNWRTGSYNQGYEGGAPKVTQDIYKRMGKQYTDIIHEQAPNTVGIDKKLQFFNKTADYKNLLKSNLPRIIAYWLGYKALNKIGDIGSEP